MVFPDMALKEVLFWTFALILGGAIGGGATTWGGLLVKKWLYSNGNDRRKSDPDWFPQFMDTHKKYLESSVEVLNVIQSLSKNMEHFTETINKRYDRVDQDHSIILREIRSCGKR